MAHGRYIGRFAPSPTGPLHAGSLVAALASWLDARAARGRWLLRIEDTDTPRCVPGAAGQILAQLQACTLLPDEEPVYQSRRAPRYEAALDQLRATGHVYPCGCSRKEIALALGRAGEPPARHAERVYPGTCRSGLHGGPQLAWRLRTDRPVGGFDPADLRWTDRRLGPQQQDLGREVGDFVLQRADGVFTYQLAVVVDDAAQGVTHVVRGEDLVDNTPRQLWLQAALGLPRPHYLHTALVRDARGEKLSKQTGAEPLDTADPLRPLADAAAALGLPAPASAHLPDALAGWVAAWSERHPVMPAASSG